MRCIKCGHNMDEPTKHAMVADVRDEEVTVEVVAAKCPNCGRVLLNSKARRSYNRAAADVYRTRHGLLTTVQLDRLRRNLGMTWKEFAEYVQIALATLKRWMGGEIQTQSLDLLVRLRADPAFAQVAFEDLYSRIATHGSIPVKPVATNRVRTRPVVELRALEPAVAAQHWSASDTQLELAA